MHCKISGVSDHYANGNFFPSHAISWICRKNSWLFWMYTCYNKCILQNDWSQTSYTIYELGPMLTLPLVRDISCISMFLERIFMWIYTKISFFPWRLQFKTKCILQPLLFQSQTHNHVCLKTSICLCFLC